MCVCVCVCVQTHKLTAQRICQHSKILISPPKSVIFKETS